MFNLDIDCNQFLDYQFRCFWNDSKKLLSKNTCDPETLSARLYELNYVL